MSNASALAADLLDLEQVPSDWTGDDLGAILELEDDPYDLAYLPSTGHDRERLSAVVKCPARCGRYLQPAGNLWIARTTGNRPLAELGRMVEAITAGELRVCLCRYNEDATRVVRDVKGDPIPSDQAPDVEPSDDPDEEARRRRKRLENAADEHPVALVLLELVDRIDLYAARLLGEA